MANKNFDQAYEILIKFQPPYRNNESDENLVENYGVYKKDFETYSKQTYNRDQYYDLTVNDFKEYFKSTYWNNCGCDEIFDGVDFLVFGYAIHTDSVTAIKKLQEVLGVSQTGTVDVATTTAIDNCDDAVKKTQILLDLQAFLLTEYSEDKFAKVKAHAQYLV
jgi:lysozyme family protein